MARAFEEYVEVEPPQYPAPMPQEVVWTEDEPVGVILGPTGDPILVVMPDREPFGFHVRRR